MNKILPLVLALAAADVARAQTIYTVSLNGTQEFPVNASPATGSGTFTLNLDNTLSYNISYSGLLGDWSASHIHGPAGPGTNAGVIFPLNNNPIDTHSGTLSGITPALTASQLNALNGGLWYANIHSTPSFSGGEIRGQLVPEPSTLALLGLGMGALVWRLRRRE